jgi:hypothetical protein
MRIKNRLVSTGEAKLKYFLVKTNAFSFIKAVNTECFNALEGDNLSDYITGS